MFEVSSTIQIKIASKLSDPNQTHRIRIIEKNIFEKNKRLKKLLQFHVLLIFGRFVFKTETILIYNLIINQTILIGLLSK